MTQDGEIRALYIKLVRLWHSDTGPASEFHSRTTTMQQLNSIYFDMAATSSDRLARLQALETELIRAHAREQESELAGEVRESSELRTLKDIMFGTSNRRTTNRRPKPTPEPMWTPFFSEEQLQAPEFLEFWEKHKEEDSIAGYGEQSNREFCYCHYLIEQNIRREQAMRAEDV